ncbi:TonB-dependent receptor [Pseudoxanthomonas sp. JBR18]|uniref:TonB-dependent receptor n=1 Tax=Pseudoxanthomonas sp. JBR18 TaxID=2969308 RepID=UPI002306CA1B|nr:TonB-dependent receptor [Pseudoxanthomonas sp. JBR18]WCE05847.1 TonB-dependent receptor [Pseudoxanthomonas sp. JBR18]
MTKTSMRRPRASASGVPVARRLATACCLALLAVQAQAQQASDQTRSADTQDQATTLDSVKVTGIRAAIANAVEKKNEATSIVETISAEDLGKLPDVSIADSLSRLPGLATQRVDGRAQVINIRGMSEQFAGTLLNGREQVSTGDSRGVEFDQYPSELINAVTVYKTPDAALIGQGLSGTVDLQTIRPLDLSERRVVFGGQGEYNSLGDLSDDGKSRGYRASASYVDQFADDTFGVALGIARLNSPFQEQHYKSWWWADLDRVDWDGPYQAGRPLNAIALQGDEAWIKSRDLQRDGVMAVFEFKPNDQFHSILDLYYSKFDQDEVMHGTMWSNASDFVGENGLGTSYTNAQTTDKDGYPVVTSGTLNNVQPIVRNDSNQRQDKLFSVGWNNAFKLGERSTFTADLSYSRAKRNQSALELYAGRLDGQSIDFDLMTTPGYSQFALPDMADAGAVYLWDPQHYNHDGRLEYSRQKDTIKAGRFNFSHDLDNEVIRSVDVGVNLNKRTKEKSADVFFAFLPGETPTLVDPSLLQSPVSLDFTGMGNVLAFNPWALLDPYYDVVLSESNDDQRKDFVVEEKVNTFYVRANIDMDLTDRIRVRGNAGMQYITTDQSSTGFNASNTSVITPLTNGAQYSDFLPSANLIFDFGEGWLIRASAAKVMMRPPINYLSADAGAGVATTGPEAGLWSGSGGNPTLEPYRANAFDLSFEKYFGEGSYVGLALFRKNLQTYIYRQNLQWDFSGYTPDPDAPTPISNIGTFNTWANGTGGYMRGAELSTALSGSLLGDWLDGWGTQLNVSYTESSIDPDPNDDSAGTDTIPGLSKVVANATVYYEKHGFSARLSQRYRDGYRGEYSALFGQRQYRNTLSERTLDFQLSYAFPEGSALAGLTLIGQVNNLTDEPFRTEVSESTGTGLFFPEEYTKYGRQYLLGFRYEL